MESYECKLTTHLVEVKKVTVSENNIRVISRSSDYGVLLSFRRKHFFFCEKIVVLVVLSLNVRPKQLYLPQSINKMGLELWVKNVISCNKAFKKNC